MVKKGKTKKAKRGASRESKKPAGGASKAQMGEQKGVGPAVKGRGRGAAMCAGKKNNKEQPTRGNNPREIALQVEKK